MIAIGENKDVSVREFVSWVQGDDEIVVAPSVIERLRQARRIVDACLKSGMPVYGLNTGLGAKLEERIDQSEIESFQRQIILGRACATGPPLPRNICKAAFLARILGLAKGVSGISVGTFRSAVQFFNAGLVPAVPSIGSIGASDLIQNAHLAAPLIGECEAWVGERRESAASALRSKGLKPAPLKAKDAIALLNHSCLSTAASALAVFEAKRWTGAAICAAAASFDAYGANRRIFHEPLQELRPAKGQSEAARWFRNALRDSKINAIRIQDPLSFRLIAPVYGAAVYAIGEATGSVELELNSASDSPAVLFEEQRLESTPNFFNPELANALRSVNSAIIDCAQSSVQRIQKLMAPGHPFLPRALSPEGGTAAGMVPLQKTANALLAELMDAANPFVGGLPPVSESVEDMASLTMLHAAKLRRALANFKLICAAEGIAASQALDVAYGGEAASISKQVRDRIRERGVSMLVDDRPLAPDLETAGDALLNASSASSEKFGVNPGGFN